MPQAGDGPLQSGLGVGSVSRSGARAALPGRHGRTQGSPARAAAGHGLHQALDQAGIHAQLLDACQQGQQQLPHLRTGFWLAAGVNMLTGPMRHQQAPLKGAPAVAALHGGQGAAIRSH